MENPMIGAYNAKGTIGNVGTPGAPIANFNLVVVPSQHAVSGTVVITQAIQGAGSHIVVNVTGKIYAAGLGKYTQLVSLEGEYVQTVPPPAIGAFLAKFNAHMAIDASWNGVGGFSYWQHDIENVPVTAAQ